MTGTQDTKINLLSLGLGASFQWLAGLEIRISDEVAV